MTVTLETWHIISLVVIVLGGYGSMGLLLLRAVERRLDQRFLAIEEARKAASMSWQASFTGVEIMVRGNEQRLTQLLVDLPLQYQRREDAIRQEVGIIHRLDAMAVKVDAISRCDHRTCPLRDHREHKEAT
jgi:hypothetical protein